MVIKQLIYLAALAREQHFGRNPACYVTSADEDTADLQRTWLVRQNMTLSRRGSQFGSPDLRPVTAAPLFTASMRLRGGRWHSLKILLTGMVPGRESPRIYSLAGGLNHFSFGTIRGSGGCS